MAKLKSMLVSEPITGAQASLGQAEYEGFKMAVEMINEQGGVMGEIPDNYDFDSSDPAVGASEAERLITTKTYQ